ncbi:MAG: ABC transporter ATP-binding protein [Candidatus Altiarchaeota archaeon]
MTIVVSVESLVKDYGTVKAVKGVSFSVGSGSIFGLVGPNGAGKTTIIKSLTGQIKPTSGRVSVLGLDAVSDPVGVRRKVGIIPEQESPPSFLTAEEYLSFVAEIRGIMGWEKEADRWFKLLDYDGHRNVLCKDLSRGTRQKLMVSQAFLHKPTIVFIDEPLVNLDPIAQKRVKDFLKGYAKEGNSVFICSHLLETVEELCDEVAILNKGEIVAEGPIHDLLKRREHLEQLFIDLVGGGDAPTA